MSHPSSSLPSSSPTALTAGAESAAEVAGAALAAQNRKIRVGVSGATGYVGLEFIRLLLGHPAYQLMMAGSRSYAGQRLDQYAPTLRGLTDLVLTDEGPEVFAENCDLVITALPHGVSSDWVSRMIDSGVTILDHSGDFRFKDLSLYENTYKLTHPRPELLEQAVYGWPEAWGSKLPGTRLISNPGCYPTCSLTALLPLAKADLLSGQIIIDAYSGTTGAGRKSEPEYGFSEMSENLKPYGVVGHRHQAEIKEQLSLLTNKENKESTDYQVIFTPHLAPIRRGMLASIYVQPSREVSQDELTSLLQEFYKDARFVRVLPAKELPQTRPLIGTNYVTISGSVDRENGVIKLFSALDNLGKGAAAQAIQALNVHYGFPEDMGLTNLPQFV